MKIKAPYEVIHPRNRFQAVNIIVFGVRLLPHEFTGAFKHTMSAWQHESGSPSNNSDVYISYSHKPKDNTIEQHLDTVEIILLFFAIRAQFPVTSKGLTSLQRIVSIFKIYISTGIRN